MAKLKDTEIYGTTKGGDITGGNYSEVREDGTQRLFGTATAWKDMVGDIFGKKLYSVAGKVDYDFDENALDFTSSGSITNSGDRVGANIQINHEHKVGTSITFKPHIHWFQDVVSGVQKAFTLTMRYRLQRNGQAAVSTWTTVTCDTGVGGDDVFDFTGEVDGTYNQLSHFPDITVDCSVSDTFQVQMARTDANGGNVLVYFMDIHGEVDSFGSDEEIAKVN